MATGADGSTRVQSVRVRGVSLAWRGHTRRRGLRPWAAMDGLYVILVLLIGIAVGVLMGWMLARDRTADSRARAHASEERAAYIENQLGDRFRALSAEVLDSTNQRFLELAEGRLRAVGTE